MRFREDVKVPAPIITATADRYLTIHLPWWTRLRMVFGLLFFGRTRMPEAAPGVNANGHRQEE